MSSIKKIMQDLDRYARAMNHKVDRFVVTKEDYAVMVRERAKHNEKMEHSALGRVDRSRITHQGIAVVEKD